MKNSENKKAKLIKKIMKQKEFERGILLQNLYKLIKCHPLFEKYYKKTNQNNPNQYQNQIRRIIQYRAPLNKNFQNKTKDFYRISHGKWTYFNNPLFLNEIKNSKKINSMIEEIKSIKNLNKTEKKKLVKIRLNQTKFRKNLIKEMERNKMGSAIKKIDDEKLLIASHILDYADCKEKWEMSNYNNGLILTPDIDLLFDKKYISFDSNESNVGEIIYSKTKKTLNGNFEKMGLLSKFKLPKALLTNDRIEFLKKRNKKYSFH